MGCMGGGMHGSIKCYIYPTSKKELKKAVHHVILENSLIIQDTIKDYYNDDTNYISMSILNDGLPYAYTLKFGGSSQYWDTSNRHLFLLLMPMIQRGIAVVLVMVV
jgi:hypothetical protein